jgi:predicted Zn-dependent protease
MRGSVVGGGIVFVTSLAVTSPCQIPPPGSSSQIQKEFALGRAMANGIERRDSILEDVAIVSYLQRVSNRIAGAAGKKALEIHVTRSTDQYAYLLPGTLYISSGLLERISSEAELAGLFAHELAHGSAMVTRPNAGSIPLMTSACVLASPVGGLPGSTFRDAENQATTAAGGVLKLAGYDPLAMLELLSKLSYEHPALSRAIDPDDLLNLRATIEPQAAPPGGYVINSSEFIEQHARLVATLGRLKKTPYLTLGPSHIQ